MTQHDVDGLAIVPEGVHTSGQLYDATPGTAKRVRSGRLTRRAEGRERAYITAEKVT